MSWMSKALYLTVLVYWQKLLQRTCGRRSIQSWLLSFGCVLAFEWGNICITQIEDNWNPLQRHKKKIICSFPFVDNCQRSKASFSLILTNALTKKFPAKPFQKKKKKKPWKCVHLWICVSGLNFEAIPLTIIPPFWLKLFLHKAKHYSRETVKQTACTSHSLSIFIRTHCSTTCTAIWKDLSLSFPSPKVGNQKHTHVVVFQSLLGILHCHHFLEMSGESSTACLNLSLTFNQILTLKKND